MKTEKAELLRKNADGRLVEWMEGGRVRENNAVCTAKMIKQQRSVRLKRVNGKIEEHL